jgi:endonuclease III
MTARAAALKRAYLVLREHGKTLCKRAAPICEPCPLDKACAHRPVTTAI